MNDLGSISPAINSSSICSPSYLLRFRTVAAPQAVLMTTLAFIFGVIPLVVASGAERVRGSRSALRPFGGMITATVIGVLLVPMLYVFSFRFREASVLRLAGSFRANIKRPRPTLNPLCSIFQTLARVTTRLPHGRMPTSVLRLDFRGRKARIET
jgi:hypothetical protein